MTCTIPHYASNEQLWLVKGSHRMAGSHPMTKKIHFPKSKCLHLSSPQNNSVKLRHLLLNKTLTL